MRFEWDPKKARANAKKHGITFEEAKTAFDDPFGAYYPDTLHETRFILLGSSSRSRLIYVVHAEVSGNAVRIISARKATKHEKAHYETTRRQAASRGVSDLLDEEVDFQRFGPVRRNAFAGADERGGPSLLALWEMPEINEGAVLLRRGHPGKGNRRKTVARSVRLPSAIWRDMERKARAKHLNLHQAMRAALLGWLRRAG